MTALCNSNNVHTTFKPQTSHQPSTIYDGWWMMIMYVLLKTVIIWLCVTIYFQMKVDCQKTHMICAHSTELYNVVNNNNSSAGEHVQTHHSANYHTSHCTTGWQDGTHCVRTHYVNDERTAGGRKVLDGADLNAWLLLLLNVSVWYAAGEPSIAQLSHTLCGRNVSVSMWRCGRCKDCVLSRVSLSLSSST